MRTERINVPTAEINTEEHNWWNTNAHTIEKIWAQTNAIQEIIRLPYLKKMKNFFLRENASKQLNILEIGCGTGWVCRNIADEHLRIIGTDFSEEQLKIARENAVLSGKDKYCTYELANTETFEKDIDGVVIHAVLHHLSKQELSLFFSEFNKLKSGTRIFIYEPVFPGKSLQKPSFADRINNRILLMIKSVSVFFAKRLGSFNAELSGQMNKIFKDAEEKGWYISPKEVPFYENELETYLSESFQLKEKFIVNRTDLEICQNLALYGIDEKPSFIFKHILIPLSRFFDKQLFKGNYKPFILENSHIFVCFQYIKK